MSFQLTIAEGKEAGKEFVFDQGSVVIGRTSDCDVILYDPGVSRKHARIFTEGEGFFVEDMGSSNGTKINGNAVKKKQLADGDNIQLGPVVFAFTSAVMPEEEVAAPAANGVAEVSTRIVAADQIKRQKNRGIALVPTGASPADVEALARHSTTNMQAVKRTPAGIRRVTPDGDAIEKIDPAPAPRGPLSAAERARIRRESGGMMANFRIFWAESGGITRGILTLLAFAFAAGVFGGVYYLANRSTDVGPTHPEPTMLTRQPIEDSFGLGDGVTWNRGDMKVFTFEFLAPVRAVVMLHFQAKDISPGEVAVTVNGVDVGQVPPDTLNSSEKSLEIIVPPAALKKGTPNQVIFDNTKNPPGHETWRIWNVWVETVLLPEVPQEMLVIEASKAFQRGQLFFERRDIGAENRYQAWKEFRNAWLMMESMPEPKPELYALARDKVRETQQELDRTCQKLLLEEEQYYNHKDWNGARSTLDHVKEYFPANDQPCAWRAEQKRAEHNL